MGSTFVFSKEWVILWLNSEGRILEEVMISVGTPMLISIRIHAAIEKVLIIRNLFWLSNLSNSLLIPSHASGIGQVLMADSFAIYS